MTITDPYKKQSQPLQTLRVAPNHAAAARTFVLRYELRATWDKVEGDVYTTFSGTKPVIDQIRAFVAGRDDALQLRN